MPSTNNTYSLHQALSFIKDLIEEELKRLFPTIDVFLDNICKEDNKEKGVYITLLHTEEEKTLKNNEYLQTYYLENKEIDGYRKVNPKLYLNLYVMVSSYDTNYEESLKHISHIISMVRHKNVFTEDDFREKEAKYNGLEKLIFDLYSLSFEQNNSLLQSIGSKLYPYVIYKVRMITIAEEKTQADMVPIRKILGLLEHFGSLEVVEEDKQNEIQEQYLKRTDKDGNKIVIVNSKAVYNEIKKKLKND